MTDASRPAAAQDPSTPGETLLSEEALEEMALEEVSEEEAPPEEASPDEASPEEPSEEEAFEACPGPAEPEGEPEDFYGWLMRSYARMREGSPDEAWEAAQKALGLGTAEPDLYVPLCQQFSPERRRQLAHAAMEKTAPSHDAFQWLWVEVAMSYWYEGNYEEAVAEYETILQQKNLDPGLEGVLENSLGMCLEAAGRHREAEQRYLKAGNPEAAVRARARSGDVEGALAMLDLGVGPDEDGIRRALEATYRGLLGQPIPDLDERVGALESYQEDWIYKEFMMGVLLVLGQQAEEGAEQLERFVEVCRANPNEWGVTLRWERGIAEEILRILSGGESGPDTEEEGEESPAPEAPPA